MSKNVVSSGQSFFNKVVETTGDIENAFSMMLLNNRSSLTDNVQVGSFLKISEITDYEVVDFFTEQNKPATLINRPIIDNSFEFMLPGEFPFSF